MTYTVYILYSAQHDKIYIGFTSQLIQRFKSHQLLGHDWTAKFRPWTVVYCEHFLHQFDARQREKQLKQYRWRLRIKHAIEQQFTQKGFIELYP